MSVLLSQMEGKEYKMNLTKYCRVLFIPVFGALLMLANLAPGLQSSGVAGPLRPPAVQALPKTPATDPAAAPADLHSTGLMLVENAGQWDPGARFRVQGPTAGGVWLTEDAIWLTLLEPSPSDAEPWEAPDAAPAPRQGVNLKLTFDGANPHPQLVPFDPLDTTVNYYLGDDPRRWRERVPVWGGVRYEGLYQGVDLVLTVEAGRWSLWFEVAGDGDDLPAILLRVEGADAVEVVDGQLQMTTVLGRATLPLPTLEGALPSGEPAVEPVPAGVFVVAAPFSPRRPSRSPMAPGDDPSDLIFSTFVGGNDSDRGRALALDGEGNVVVTGDTESADFPTTPGAYDTSLRGTDDVFVLKLAADGGSLLYSTFVGGGYHDYGDALALDGAGNVVVTGNTFSRNFPTTPGAYDTSYGGGYDVFVLKLAEDGGSLLYSTYVGHGNNDFGRALALDGAGEAVVTGVTFGAFPTTPGAYDTTSNGERDVFVLKLAADGGSLVYSTYVGGAHGDAGRTVALDGVGAAVVAGSTESADFPTTPSGYDTSHNGEMDVFVLKLAADGGSLLHSTFMGGGGDESGAALMLDGAGDIVVTGDTESADFPTTPGAYDRSFNGDHDVFVLKLAADGGSLLHSTLVGGGYYDYGQSLALDGPEDAIVTGSSESSDFPITPGAYDTSHNGDWDVFVLKLSVAAEPTFSVSGHVTDKSDTPIADVTVSSGDSGSAVTDASGAYTLTNLFAGSYVLTPAKAGWIFTPLTRPVAVPPDAYGQDFTGAPTSSDHKVYLPVVLRIR